MNKTRSCSYRVKGLVYGRDSGNWEYFEYLLNASLEDIPMMLQGALQEKLEKRKGFTEFSFKVTELKETDTTIINLRKE